MNQRSSQSIWKRKSTFLMAGGVIVAAAVLFIGLTGFPPSDGESVGAIGMAERWRGEQMTDGDVLLQDLEIQALLQNDDIQRLLADGTFQKAVKDPNFSKMAEHKLMKSVILDAEFMQYVLESGMRARLEKAGFANLQPDEAYSVFRNAVHDAELSGAPSPVLDIAESADFALLFKQHNLVQTIWLDQEFMKQAMDLGLQVRLNKVDYENMTGDAALAQIRKIANDAAISGRSPLVADMVNDAAFAKLFVSHGMVRRIFMDFDLMGKRMDIADEAGLYDAKRAMSDFDDVKRARSDFDDVNRAAKDFDDVNRAAKDFDDVNRAAKDFDDVKRAAKDFDDVKRAASEFDDVNRAARITDIDPAAHLVDHMRASPWKSMTPDAALASFRAAASDASLATNKRRIYDMVSDQEFAKMFKANGFAQRALLDENFIQLVIDPDFAMLINHKVASKIILDVDLASRLIEHGLMNRRQE